MSLQSRLEEYAKETAAVDEIYSKICSLISKKCRDEKKFIELLQELSNYKDRGFAAYQQCVRTVTSYLDELPNSYFDDYDEK